MAKPLLQINKSDIRIRPSAITSFYGCAFQWAKRFLEGEPQGPSGARASIGTGIHSGAEAFWKEVTPTGDREKYSLSAITDAAVESFREDIKDGVLYDDGENENTAIKEIASGVEAFADDIGQFVLIPDFVEEYFEVEIDHPLVVAVGGTIDYLARTTLADIKTSKRKVSAQSHVVQQSTYRYLAEANGHIITNNAIQGVVLKKSGADGMVMPLETNVEQAKFLINGILDRIDLALIDAAPLHVLFPGNPGYMFCSPKYCERYDTCPFVKGNDLRNIQIAL